LASLAWRPSFLRRPLPPRPIPTGVDFDVVDYIDRAASLDMPILLFHGTEDGTVPHAISENLTAARPDLVQFHSIPDADHVRAWNEDPDWYRDTVTAFLARIGRTE
jgi:fermentation-respiration switch protein FrsA (DUF1100 family)